MRTNPKRQIDALAFRLCIGHGGPQNQGDTSVAGLALSGTGLYTPAQSISNEELVASFNEYVRRFNAAHADAIAAGSMEAL